MQLAAREKEILFNDLAQLMRSGMPFRAALEHLARHSSRLRHTVERMLAAGASPEECFGAVPERFDPVDFAIVTAGVESGRLHQAFAGLGEYYGSIAQCRERALRGLYYPLVVFHLGVFLLNLPTLIVGDGPMAFLKQVFSALFVFYLLCIALYAGVRFLLRCLENNAAFQGHFRRMPILGRIPYQLALWRFSLVTSLLVGSGIGIYRALEFAGKGCKSALIWEGTAQAIAASRNGATLADAFHATDAFSEEVLRHISLGEADGRLDIEMKNAADSLQEKFLHGITLVSRILPQAIYLGILLYLGYQIIALYMGNLAQIKSLLDE